MMSKAQDGAQVWIVFQTRPGGVIEFQGVFGTETRAIEACRNDMHCACPAIVGEELPQETKSWQGAWYPGCETKPDQATP